MKICKTKKSKIIVLSLLIGIIAIIGGTATYAFWKITKIQANANDIVSSCLNISFQTAEGSSGVNLLNEMPITDEEAQDYDGYEFIIKNHCDDPVEFYLAAKKITDDEDSIKNSSISMSISTANDDDIISSDFKSLSNVDEDDDSTKIVRYDTLAGKEEKTYTYKMWINETSDIEDESKEFETKLIATAGQGVVDESRATYAEGCYIINGLGTIAGYRVEENDLDGNTCVWTSAQVAASDYAENDEVQYVADVTIPNKVAGISVKSLDKNSMLPKTGTIKTYTIYKYILDDDDEIYVVENKNDDFYLDYVNLMGFSSLEDASSVSGLSIDAIKEKIDEDFLDSYDGTYKEKIESNLQELSGGEYFMIINSLDLSSSTDLKTIGEAAFLFYTGYNDDLDIPSNVNVIGDYAFISYSGKSLTLHEGLESIGDYAFGDDSYGYYNGISSDDGFIGENSQLIIPDSVKTIGNLAFYRFNGSYLKLGNGLETLGAKAFYKYEGIGETLAIPGTLKNYTVFDKPDNEYWHPYKGSQFYAFKGSELIIENGVKNIENYMFESYVGTGKDLIIPDSVQSIGYGAFYHYNGETINFGSSISSIASYAFKSYVGSNKTLIMPNNLVSIDLLAFEEFNGSKLLLNNKLKTIGEGVFRSYVGTNQELIIPDSVTDIGPKTTAFGRGVFESFNGSNLIIGNSTKFIGDVSFRAYVGLNKELYIPSSVETISDGAFSHYNGTKLILNEGLKTIGESAFVHGSASSDPSTFGGYVGTGQNLVLPDSLVSLGKGSFAAFNGNDIVFGSKLTTIPVYGFSGYEGNNSTLVIPSTITSIGRSGFYSYKGTGKTLTIPNTLKKLDSAAFYSFNGVNLLIENGVEIIGDNAFMNYKGTSKSLTIPNSVTYIGHYTFPSFIGTSVSLGTGITQIGLAGGTDNAYSFKDFSGNIYTNRTKAEWDAAVANGTLKLSGQWNGYGTVVYN